jgi:hypothetical protein
LSEIVLLGANVNSYSDLSVASGNTYRYVVKAVNDAGSSAPSDTAQAATDIPGLPTGLTATVISGTEVNLAWTDNASTETGFSIERCTGAACTDFAEIVVAAADAEAYSDVSVEVSTSYRYRVRAVNANGSSGYTNIATAATNPPAAPTDLAAVTVSATRIDLSWTDNSNNETSSSSSAATERPAAAPSHRSRVSRRTRPCTRMCRCRWGTATRTGCSR